MEIGASKDGFGAYSVNCEGFYAAGDTRGVTFRYPLVLLVNMIEQSLAAIAVPIEATKADAEEAIRLIKKNLPEERWPDAIKGEYKLEWQMDVPSFLEYYSRYMSLAGMEQH